MTQVLIVPGRFRGPASSGNGGWTAGALAGLLGHETAETPGNRCDSWPPIRVSLRQPPPLDIPMPVTVADGVATANHDGAAVATAALVDADPVPVEPVPAELARHAEASYAGLVAHPFPTCFSCGPGREDGDGLRIFPGEVGHDPTAVAATWTPHPSVAEDWHEYADQQGLRHASLAVTWAALDCVGGWGGGDLPGRPMVLAAMTARVDALPVIGEEHVLVGEDRGREGRKSWTAATLYDHDGRVVASAEHLWIAVDPGTFG
jgi:hypothetical protein